MFTRVMIVKLVTCGDICVCLDKHTAMFNSYQLWLMNFSGFLPTMVSTTSILDQRNYKPIRFDLA